MTQAQAWLYRMHTPMIDTATARCSCGRMPAIIRPSSEPIGAFTERAYGVWTLHVTMAHAPAQGDLFPVQQELFT